MLNQKQKTQTRDELLLSPNGKFVILFTLTKFVNTEESITHLVPITWHKWDSVPTGHTAFSRTPVHWHCSNIYGVKKQQENVSEKNTCNHQADKEHPGGKGPVSVLTMQENGMCCTYSGRMGIQVRIQHVTIWRRIQEDRHEGHLGVSFQHGALRFNCVTSINICRILKAKSPCGMLQMYP